MLPNHEQAYIPEPKLTKYLLSETHAVGKAKAKYFRSFGYTETNVDQLADGLLMIAKSKEVSQAVPTPYGTKYIMEGIFLLPSEPPCGSVPSGWSNQAINVRDL